MRYVRKAVEARKNRVMQTLMIHMEEGITATGAYLSPPASAEETGRVFHEILKDNSVKVVVGDLNAVHYLWDTSSNDT